mmetsp:Transcript_87470/g.245576  ORF Transcript_87470/g.245576 Transcript_87470/m.245576 type:complete len:248 (+) Transcript_87470:292-1035(+)
MSCQALGGAQASQFQSDAYVVWSLRICHDGAVPHAMRASRPAKSWWSSRFILCAEHERCLVFARLLWHDKRASCPAARLGGFGTFRVERSSSLEFAHSSQEHSLARRVVVLSRWSRGGRRYRRCECQFAQHWNRHCRLFGGPHVQILSNVLRSCCTVLFACIDSSSNLCRECAALQSKTTLRPAVCLANLGSIICPFSHETPSFGCCTASDSDDHCLRQLSTRGPSLHEVRIWKASQGIARTQYRVG